MPVSLPSHFPTLGELYGLDLACGLGVEHPCIWGLACTEQVCLVHNSAPSLMASGGGIDKLPGVPSTLQIYRMHLHCCDYKALQTYHSYLPTCLLRDQKQSSLSSSGVSARTVLTWFFEWALQSALSYVLPQQHC